MLATAIRDTAPVWEQDHLRLLEHNLQPELVQLAFNSHDDWTRKEFVETGVWLNLQTGAVQLTRNYRPHKAARHIREDDSCFHIVACSELCLYPGNLNPRVRWEASEPRPVGKADYLGTCSPRMRRGTSRCQTCRTYHRGTSLLAKKRCSAFTSRGIR